MEIIHNTTPTFSHAKWDETLQKINIVILTIFMGLFFQVAWQYPVVDSFPLIERILNPDFLPNDFYTNTFDAFSPRLILASCIAYISELLEVHYTLVVAYGNILRIWIYAIGLYWFFKQLVQHQVALIAFALSALSFLSVPFLPAWWPVTFDFTASNVALTFSIFAWGMVLKGKVATALWLMTGAVIFHPLVGVHGVILCVLIFLSYHGWAALWPLFKSLPTYIASAVFLTAFLALYLSFDKVLDNARFAEINGTYRHAHHFLLSHMDLEKWVSTAFMFIISCVLLWKLDLAKEIRRLAITIFTYAIAMTILGFLFVELWPTRFMVSFIPMRAFPVIVPIMVVIWAYFAFILFKQKQYIAFLFCIVPFLPYKQVGLTWFVFPNHHDLMLPIITIPISLFGIYISTRSASLIQIVNRTVATLASKVSMSPTPSLFILPIAACALLLSLLKFDLNIPYKETEAEIYGWLQENTQPNDVLISELNAANNQKIRLVSHRAVVVSKDFPFNEQFYEDWYERYSNIYLERDSARGHIDQLSSEQLANLMDQFSANVLIRTQALEPSEAFELIGQVQGEHAPAFIYRKLKQESP